MPMLKIFIAIILLFSATLAHAQVVPAQNQIIPSTYFGQGYVISTSSSPTHKLGASLVDLAGSFVTGILGVARGGLGISTVPGYGLIPVGNGTGYTLTATSSLGITGGSGSPGGSSGQVQYNAAGTFGGISTSTLTGGSQVAVSNSPVIIGGAGAVLSIVADSIGDTQLAFNTGQNLTTASSPTFAGATITGLSGCVNATAGVLGSTGSACGSGGGGTGSVATSSSETAGQIPFWTSTNGTPALLSGGSSNFVWNSTTNSLGIGTSTPWGRISITPTAADGVAPPFVISSSTAGTRFIVTNAGYVGIGTATPAPGTAGRATLVINDPTGNTGNELRLTGGNTAGRIYTNSSQLGFITETSDREIVISAGGTSSGVSIGANSTTRLSVLGNTGNVGVSSTTPWGSLSVNPNAIGTAPAFVVGSSSATSFLVSNGGRVGISTTSPSWPLSVEAGSASTIAKFTGSLNGFQEINVQNRSNGANASSDITASADNGNDTSHYIDLGINGSGGGAAPFTGVNEAYLYAVDDQLNIGSLGASGAIKLYTTGGAATPLEQARLTSTGRFGLGTSTPSAKLAIEASAGNSTTSPLFAIGSSTANNVSIFNTVATRVGIGATTTPWRTLSIVGTIANTGMTAATAGTNNDVCISATGDFVNETTGTCVVSSRRFKHAIDTLTLSATDLISGLRPVIFSPNSDDVADFEDRQYGFIAEEVADQDPHLAKYGVDGLPRTLDDRGILSITVKAVQELIAKVTGQEARINALEARIEKLEKSL